MLDLIVLQVRVCALQQPARSPCHRAVTSRAPFTLRLGLDCLAGAVACETRCGQGTCASPEGDCSCSEGWQGATCDQRACSCLLFPPCPPHALRSLRRRRNVPSC